MKTSTALLTLTAVLATACSSKSAPEAAFRELTLLGLEPTHFPGPEPLAQWLDLGKQASKWQISGGRTQTAERDGSETLQLERNTSTTIRIPVDLAAGDLDRLVLGIRETTRGKSRIKLTVHLGKLRFSGPDEAIGLTLGTRELSLELPFAAKQKRGLLGRRIDLLELTIPAAKGPLELLSMTAMSVPAADHFPPTTRGGIDLVTVGGDARRATCLKSGAPLSTRFEVTDERQVLHFSFALPAAIQRVEGQPRLRVTLNESSHTLDFLYDQDGLGRWAEFGLPLGDWVGQQLTARFELITADDLELICALGAPQLATPVTGAPTVVLITSDTHRADHLGFLDNGISVRTPNLERLARRGILFTDVLSSANNTGPSHISLFTGMSPRDTGVTSNGHSLNPAAETLAELFHANNFATLASVSAMPVDNQVSGLGQGFDQYLVPDNVSEQDSSVTLARLMEELPKYDDVPLFLWVHIFDAHAPYGSHPGEPEPSQAGPEGLYSAEIAHLDAGLGQLFDLERFRAATIAFTADHGEVLDRGLDPAFNHVGLSLNTLAVPLILVAPGQLEPQTITRPVASIDIGRTLLDLAGLDAAGFPGSSLLEITSDDAQPRFALEAHGFGVAVQWRQWLFTLQLRPREHDLLPPDQAIHSVRLFDLENDPYNETNVWETNMEVTRQLRSLALQWLAESNPLESIAAVGIDPAKLQESLAKLGYTMDAKSDSAVWFDTDCSDPWCPLFE